MRILVLFSIVLCFTHCDFDKRSDAATQASLEDEFGVYHEVIPAGDSTYYEKYNKTLALWDVPYHEVDLSTSLGTAHIIVAGAKSDIPIVLLHGMGASSTSWYPNIAALAENNRVYAIDYLLEPGKSRPSKSVSAVEEIFDWYEEVFEALEIEKMHLVGMSKGGWLSVNIALNSPDRIQDLVLLSPAQTFKWIKPSLGILANVTFSMIPSENKLDDVLSTLSEHPEQIAGEFKKQYLEGLEEDPYDKFMMNVQPFSSSELEQLDMPVLVIIGDKDIINDQKSLKDANKHLKDCETLTISDAGHFVPLDQPEQVNEEILSFIEDHQK